MSDRDLVFLNENKKQFRNIFPKTKEETILTLFNIVYTNLNTWFTITVTMPSYCDALFCETSVKGRISSDAAKRPEWKYCPKCNISVPPRSWHCRICNDCILKRSHHCFFTSCCVGYYNLRYFYMYTLYTTLSFFYTTYFGFFYVWEPTAFSNVLKLFFPFISLFLVQQFTFNVGHLLFFTSLVITVILYYFCLFSAYLLLKNDRLWRGDEVSKNGCDKGILNNIKDVFGDKWYLVWLGPWVRSTLPGDGTNS